MKNISVESLLGEGLVFSGRAIDVKTTYGTYEGQQYPERSVAVFVVDAWFASHYLSDTVTVHTGGGMGDCGLTFSVGETWLIYTYEREGINYSSSCTQSRKIFERTGNIEERSEWYNGPYTISGFLKDGKPVRQWLRTRDGDTIAIFNFNENGQRQGYQMEENEDFNETLEFYYETTDSSVKIFDSKRANLIKFYELKDGLRHGRYEEYWNGGLRLEANYIKGRLDGEWTSWHEDEAIAKGKIKTVKRFLRDRLISSVRLDESARVID